MITTSRLAVFLVVAAMASAQSFVNFESGPVHAVRVSADGSRLFVADTTGDRLAVFDLGSAFEPRLVAEIPVGLDPVSVHPRTRDEVWVANLLSDSVSIVSVSQRCVVETLRVVDEPSDVVFANGRAFVTAATSDTVHVFDAVTRASLGTVAVFGKDPRSLAVSPDGSRVYAVVQRSGNGTTIVPESVAPLPPPPTNPALPLAPAQGVIVRADDPAWAGSIAYSLPDHDVAEIDAAALTVTRYFNAVGTTNTGIAVHPVSGDLWVANTEARNLVRFEPNLKGHAIDSRVTRITTGAAPTITPFDLNPGINYGVLPNPAAQAVALAEPFGVAIDALADRLYVAAHGTDRVGVLDLAGNIIARIEIGNTPGAAVNTRDKRGPRALALHPTQDALYVYNRLSDTLTVVDTASLQIRVELPIATWDPMPHTLREGRKFLYDSKLSGNGTMSCASCHVDGETDGLAWDLGNPDGVLQPPPPQPFPFSLALTQFHPMKGPMTTQTLRGLAGTGPLHWRGDRPDFQSFNAAFEELMGGARLSNPDINDYAAFGMTIAVPPNPHQRLDRTYRTTPGNNNEADGLVAFQAQVANLPLIGQVGCTSCHAMPDGTNGMVVAALALQTPQQAKVAALRTLYRKVGFVNAPGPQKAGFGFTHDGAVGTLSEFVNLSQFSTWPSQTKDDMATFLMSFDSGTAPTVGHQATAHAGNAGSSVLLADLTLLQARAAAGDIELVAHGVLDGRMAGLLYRVPQQDFLVDRSGEGPYSAAQLLAKAGLGDALLTFTGVPPGSGPRLGLDRDLDGLLDGDEAASRYGSETAGCGGAPTLLANSEPRVGNGQFALALGETSAGAVGFLVIGLAATSAPVAGIELLVDPASSVARLVTADPFGGFVAGFPIPGGAQFAGLPLFGQVGWLDPCGPAGFSSSRGLAFPIVP